MSECPSCHQPATAADVFCGACGAALRSNDGTVAPTTATQGTDREAAPASAPGAVPAPAVDTASEPPVVSAQPGEPPRELRILGYATMAAAAVAATCIIPGTLALRYSDKVDLASKQSISDLGDVSSLLYLGGFLIGAILFMILTYKLRTNLDRLNVTGLRYGADQAIWPWFIPFFNLVRPVRFVSDLGRGLRGRGERPGRLPYQTGTAVSAPGVITLWWILFIAAGPLGNAGRSSAAGVFIASLAWSAVSVATVLVVYTLLKLNWRAVAAFNAEQPDASA